jgi:hypothetical protein
VTAQDLRRAAPPRPPATAAGRGVAPRRARRPAGLIAASSGVAVLLALPLVFLLIETSGSGLQ